MSVWHEVISKGKTPTNGELDPHHEQVSAALAGNVYSFGILLLEIISGKLPDPAHERSLVSLALECINNGDRSLVSLLDPTLNDRKEDELAVIGKVIHACIQSDPRNRPSMREITARLREAIGISPVAATPRLSPLWWAELEVLSAAEAG
jgi:serine/threonine protein kinase